MTAVNYPGTVYLRVIIDLQVEFSKFTVVWYTAGNMRIPPHVMSCFIITTLSTHQTLTLPLHAQNLPFHLDYLDRSLHQTYHVHSFSSFLPRDTIHSMPYTQQTVRERDVWYLKTGVERTDCRQIVYKLVMFSRTEPTSFALAEQPLRLQTTYITGIHF